MAISYINTTEVDNIGKEITSLASDFNTEINNLFNRFSNVPSVSKEWVGTQSKFYFAKVANDKKKYIEFADKLRDIGYKLNNDVYEVQNCIRNNVEEESRKGS